ncbi:MAG: hypothetical protein GC149_15795 [Gammaproteobacteria bacterium]|nr:hypothetical protein [Gammaproteobacteria bacterium]
MQKITQTTQAPPWLVRALTPFIARTVARQMINKYPGLSGEEIISKMRAEAPETAGNAQAEALLAAVARHLPDRPITSKPVTDTKPLSWHSPSSLVLIGANLIPLYGVLVLGWPVFPILLLFWLENVVVGLLNALRMLLADPSDPALWATKLFMVPFFCFHYGMFTAVHGQFVIHLFGGSAYKNLDKGLWPLEGAVHAISEYNLGWAVLGLAASHLFSLLWNYIGRGEYRLAAINKLMTQPYNRVVVLHITIIIGGGIAMSLGSPVWALLLLLALKIGFDLKAHIKEHHKTAAD